MKKLLLLLIFIPTLAHAQQKSIIQTQIETFIGASVVENLSLKIRIEEQDKQIEALKKQIEDSKKEKQ